MSAQIKIFSDPVPQPIDGVKPTLFISFSGGRTSAYMTYTLLKEYSHLLTIIVIFTNTGCEHEKTLKFINDCDQILGFKTIWLEAATREHGKSNTWKIVDYKTASRNGEPYRATVEKYGMVGITKPKCSDRLKYIPMNNYKKDKGMWGENYYTAIGIRSDEVRRVKEDLKKKENVIYPLVDWFPTNKEMVLNFWKEQEFDLEIPEYLGNCVFCFKKSLHKLVRAAQEEPEYFKFPCSLEEKHTKENDTPMFRNYVTANQIVKMATDPEEYDRHLEMIIKDDLERNTACDDSCEPYQMEAEI